MSIFHRAAKTAFKVAKKLSLVHQVVFRSIDDNGIDEATTTELTVEAIKEKFNQDDIRGLMFRDKIQPSDIKLLIQGIKISEINTDDIFIIDGVEYTVFGCEIDAAGAVWTVGVR